MKKKNEISEIKKNNWRILENKKNYFKNFCKNTFCCSAQIVKNCILKITTMQQLDDPTQNAKL